MHFFLGQKLGYQLMCELIMVNITVDSFINLKKLYIVFNSLTPVPLVTARDEPWPFFLF